MNCLHCTENLTEVLFNSMDFFLPQYCNTLLFYFNTFFRLSTIIRLIKLSTTCLFIFPDHEKGLNVLNM